MTCRPWSNSTRPTCCAREEPNSTATCVWQTPGENITPRQHARQGMSAWNDANLLKFVSQLFTKREHSPMQPDITLDYRYTSMADEKYLFDPRPLRYFMAAAQEASFTRAANILGIRASTVSRGIRDFEDRIGVAIFERSTSGARLTDAGNRFLSEIAPALWTLERAIQNAGAAGRAEVGTLRLGLSISLAGGSLKKIISIFIDHYRDIKFEVRDGSKIEHFQGIRERQVDMAFVIGRAKDTDLDIMDLWRERVYVAFSKDNPLSNRSRVNWRDLSREQFIVSSTGSGQDVQEYIGRRFSDNELICMVSNHSTSTDNLMHMASIGLGVTIVLEGWANVHYPGLVLRPLEGQEDLVTISAAWSPANDNPALRRFISFIRSHLRD